MSLRRAFAAIVFLLAAALPAWAQTVPLGPRFVLPYQSVADGTGAPIPGALLYFYASGTRTRLNTYSDPLLTVPNSNPVVANAAGVFPNIFLSGNYKVVLTDSSNNQIWTADPVYDIIGQYSPNIVVGTTGVIDGTSGQLLYDNAGLLGATSALPNGTTATTQSSGDSTTKVATDAFVQQATTLDAGTGISITGSNPATVAVSLVPTANGGTGAASFTAGEPLLGNGTGALTQGTLSGNTTEFVTTTGTQLSGNCVQIDGNGNHVAAGAPCGAGNNTPYVDDFIAGTNFTPGTTTTLTLSHTPSAVNMVAVAFDGVTQAHSTYSLSTATLTFDAAIPTNTQVVEVQYYTAATLAGVGAIGNASGDTTLTFAGTGSGPYTGAVTAEINPAASITWTASQKFVENNGGNVQIDTPSTGQSGCVAFYDAGTVKWQQCKGSADDFAISGPARGTDFDIASGGNMALMPNGGGVSIGSTSGLNIPGGGLAAAGDVYFGSGRPWVDVRSGANGCAAATGNGSTDDTAAIQCQLNYMNSTYAGGIVFFPPGTYLVSGGGVIIKGGDQLIGTGQNSSVLYVLSDSSVVSWDSSCKRGTSLQSFTIDGYQNAATTQNAVYVYDNCPVIIRDDTIWLGYNAIQNNGTDSLIENVFACGYNASVASNGANWYIRDKLDTCGITSAYAFTQGTYVYSGVAENHFDQTDFSNGSVDAIYINDGGTSTAITYVTSGVIGTVLIANAKYTSFVGDEIAGPVATNNDLVITGSIGVGGAFTVTGSGSRSCSGNINITC